MRQLESMIRLSEALARLYLDDTVRVEYVAEAYRLMEQTLKDIHTDDVNLQRVERDLEQARQIRREREKELAAQKQLQQQSKRSMRTRMKTNSRVRLKWKRIARRRRRRAVMTRIRNLFRLHMPVHKCYNDLLAYQT